MADIIKIKTGAAEVKAELNNSRTAKALMKILPLHARVNTWGEEIYFAIPLSMELENGKEVVEMGDIGYWPDGNSLCLFFGPTPASRGDEIRAASAVTILGKIVGDPKALKSVKSGAEVTVEKVTSA